MCDSKTLLPLICIVMTEKASGVPPAGGGREGRREEKEKRSKRKTETEKEEKKRTRSHHSSRFEKEKNQKKTLIRFFRKHEDLRQDSGRHRREGNLLLVRVLPAEDRGGEIEFWEESRKKERSSFCDGGGNQNREGPRDFATIAQVDDRSKKKSLSPPCSLLLLLLLFCLALAPRGTISLW